MAPLLKGIMLGFSIAAPVGPIGLLCIQRSLTRGPLAGLVTGLGAATADALYGAVAAFGLASVSNYLLQYTAVLQVSGGLFLIYLGGSILRRPSSRATEPARNTPESMLRYYATTVALTVANPLTILSFAAAFAGLGLVSQDGGMAAATALVAGVFAGSAAWWLLLSQCVGAVGARLTSRHLRWVNVAAGAVILCIAVWQLAGFASTHLLHPPVAASSAP